MTAGHEQRERTVAAGLATPRQTSGYRRVAWSGLDRRFQANLALFDQRAGLGDALMRCWQTCRGKLQLYACADGNFQVFSRLPEAAGWLPALAPHNQSASVADLRRQWRGIMVSTLAVSGLGMGYVPLAVIAASRRTFLDYSAPVILLEPSLLAWAVVLHLHDWQAALGEARLRICAGSGAWAAFEAELADPDRVTPVVLSGGPPWPGSPTPQQVARRVAAAARARRATQRRLYGQLCRALAGRDRAFWARRLAHAGRSQPPLTVLGITSRHTTVLQYSTRDLLAAFARLGHRTHVFMEADDCAHFSPLRLLREMRRLRPDLVILADHLHAEYEDLFPDNLPGICWIQDRLPHLFRKQAGKAVRPLEYVIGHGFPECLTEFDYPPQRFYPCLIPTNPQQMRDPGEKARDLQPYRCDVMYATHASESPAELHALYRERFTGDGLAFWDAAYETVLALARQPWFCGDYHYPALVARVEQQAGIRISDPAVRGDVVNLLQQIADRFLREQTVRAAARWADQSGGRFHLYGRGWERRPEFARFARGVLAHGRPLARAFRAARISLHAGCNPALHQRVLDGLCAGGFFLFWEKPSDSMHDLAQAIYRFYRQQRPPLPFRLKPQMLPEPFAGRLRRSMQMRGVDPATGNRVDRQRIVWLKFACQSGRVPSASGVWPCYQRVLFRNAEQLPERIDYFLRHPEQRRELAAQMRAVVMERFTYDALVRDVLSFMRRDLEGRGGSLLSELDLP